MNTLQQIRFIWKLIVFLLCLVPAVLLVTDALEITGRLGANPVEEIQDRFERRRIKSRYNKSA